LILLWLFGETLGETLVRFLVFALDFLWNYSRVCLVFRLSLSSSSNSLIRHIQCLSAESSHWYNMTVKLTKYLEFWRISCNFSNIRCLTTRISMWRISTLAQNLYDIKNKHRSIWARSSQFLISQLFHYNLAHRLSIARYCLRFAPFLHSCITYCFFIHDAPSRILKRVTDVIMLSFYCHINFSYLCSIKVALSLQIVEKSSHFPLISSLIKQLSPFTNIFISNTQL
jgi:hypothetical protein